MSSIIERKMQRRLSCATDITGQPSIPLRTYSQHSKNLRRTSAQESLDNHLKMLKINNKRKSFDSIFGQIQPDLYRRRESSIISLNSQNNENNINIIGKLQLQINYDNSLSDLIIKIIKVQINKLILEQFLNNNCFIRINISINDEFIGRNYEQKINLNKEGEWLNNELIDKSFFKLPLGQNEIFEAILIIELFLNISSSQKYFKKLAICSIPFNSFCLINKEILTIWTDLEIINKEYFKRGEILVCLQYLPSAERLTLSLHQVANINLCKSSINNNNLNKNNQQLIIPTELFIYAKLID
ncbi:hypothetical protein ACQ4LE_004486, partial [Meloidogyne hapla]